MAKLIFGTDEKTTCIVDVAIRGPHGEALCLAYKTSIFHIGLPAHIHDDGYVLKPKTGDGAVYYPLTQNQIVTYQSEGKLPSPLPSYALSLGDYFWGYYLWIAIVGGILWVIGRRKWKARQARRLVETLRGEPLRGNGPRLRTDEDHYIYNNAAPLLRNGERLLHQAYALDRNIVLPGFFRSLLAREMFVALTTHRLMIFPLPIRIHRRVFKTKKLEAIERADMRAIQLDGRALLFRLSNGEVKRLVVPLDEKAFSNQRDFVVGAAEAAGELGRAA